MCRVLGGVSKDAYIRMILPLSSCFLCSRFPHFSNDLRDCRIGLARVLRHDSLVVVLSKENECCWISIPTFRMTILLALYSFHMVRKYNTRLGYKNILLGFKLSSRYVGS